MIIEYDDEDRCIRVDGEPISYGRRGWTPGADRAGHRRVGF